MFTYTTRKFVNLLKKLRTTPIQNSLYLTQTTTEQSHTKEVVNIQTAVIRYTGRKGVITDKRFGKFKFGLNRQAEK